MEFAIAQSAPPLLRNLLDAKRRTASHLRRIKGKWRVGVDRLHTDRLSPYISAGPLPWLGPWGTRTLGNAKMNAQRMIGHSPTCGANIVWPISLGLR